MSQKTNLNVNPYYDDFDKSKNFYKVLFNSGVPVQARELTTLQSILQNQIEDFGSHVFSEGSVVIPGNITYENQFYAVRLNANQFGVDISTYIENFIGKIIVGTESNISAKVRKVVFPTESNEINYITLYVSYLESDENFEFSQFIDGESIFCNQSVQYGNTTINSGVNFATLIDSNSTSIGSAAFISKGVYFVRGYFVAVEDQSIILDYYTNNPSYRVGLSVSENLVTVKDDESLYDNAKGFANYSAPGADRLQITLTLVKKSLEDLEDFNFIELLRVKDGKLKKKQIKTEYNKIRDYFAERTFDESGNYAVRPFEIKLLNSLNDRLVSNGIFFDDVLTEQGNTPSNDLACLQISPGKAYVSGYDIEKNFTEIIDVEKPRDTATISNLSTSYEIGNILTVNTVSGTPKLREVVTLHSQLGGLGTEIGKARVYSFNLSNAPYVDDSTIWDLRLYDIQTYTKLTLNSPVSATEIKESYFIKGKSSGASGFAVSDGSSNVIFLRETSGTFSKGESLIVNGIDFSRTITEQISYGSQNIKSVSQTNPFGYGSNFTANSVLSKFNFPNNISQITITNGGQVTSTGKKFLGIRVDSIVRYQKPGQSLETYNRISSISNDFLSFTVSAIQSVPNVYDGTLPGSDIQVNAILGAPQIRGSGTLYTELPESNISSVELSGSNVYLIDQIVGKTVGVDGSLILNTNTDISNIDNSSWTSFDEERYSVIYGSTGAIADNLNSSAIQFSGNDITFRGLNPSSTNMVINTTIFKSGIQSKIKNLSRSKVLSVEKSKYLQSGTDPNNSLDDGLQYNEYYGLRVQDEEISLNHPDVLKVLAVYESFNANDPILDRIKFSSLSNVSQNALIGENIIGSQSNAVARVVTNSSTIPSNPNNILGIIYLNGNRFSVGETVFFEESDITTTIEEIQIGSYKDITKSFKLNRGQKEQYYDYSKLVRNKNTSEPSRKILVVFDHYTVPSNDNGDIFTVNSYDKNRFLNDIPYINGSVRSTDTLDFRPRVEVFDPSITNDRSPFDFTSRTTSFNTAPLKLLAPNERFTITQSYYLPRIDKVYLDTNGNFIVDKGVSAKSPKPPSKKSELLELCTIELPAYLYDPRDASISMRDNKRYTMRDIGVIEDRVNVLEEVTSLSLLELNTQSLQISDSEGRNRFKSGFFVDDFVDSSRINTILSTTIVDTASRNLIPNITRDSLDSLIATSEDLNPQNLDLSDNLLLLDPSVQKTGKSLTLSYDEIGWLEQSIATKIENVNPFNVVVYSGSVQLNPSIDNWTRTVQLQDRTIIGNLNNQSINLNNSLTNRLITNLRQNLRANLNSTERVRIPAAPRNRNLTRRELDGINRSISFNSSSSSTSRSTDTSVSFDRSTSSGSFDTVDTTIDNRIVGTFEDQFIRSRNVEIKASNLKPNTRFYQFLDGNSNIDVIPKLIEISKNKNLNEYGSSSSFEIGETVIGYVNGSERIRFRVCTPNHKFGRFNSPSEIYNINPYLRNEIIPSQYSSNSKILNIDTTSLSENAQGDYYGYIVKGMQLVGQTSKSISFVKDIRLISDNYGDLISSFFIRNPNRIPRPLNRISTGTKTYRLTSSRKNESPVPGSTTISFAETNYSANATVIQFQSTIRENRTRNTINNTISNRITDTTNSTITLNSSVSRNASVEYFDPLAQTFTVGGNIQVKSNIDTEDDSNGVFLTSVDLFFESIDQGNAEVRVEVRTTLLGTPTLEVIGSPVFLKPKSVDENGNETVNINTSDDGSVATNVKFPEPIFLAPGREYAIVIISDKSDEYTLWTAVMGEKSVSTTNLPDVDSIRYTKQFALGTLFKSQNGSIWTTNQYQDLKFKLYKAQFNKTTGTAYFYNPPLNESNGYVATLNNNPAIVLPKTGKIGIDTITDIGTINTLSTRKLAGVNGNGGESVVIGTGSSVTGVDITESGNNYSMTTPEIVSTYNVIGQGQDLKLNVTSVVNGEIAGIGISILDAGHGYQVGDVVGIVTSSTSGLTGSDCLITISSINGVDTLYLDNVIGEFGDAGTGKEFSVGAALSYYNNSGEIVSLAGTTITSSYGDDGINSGNYLKIEHFNHGMYSSANKVLINNIQSDIPLKQLVEELPISESNSITIDDASDFSTFEGFPVSSSNPGYVKIGDEIIKYNNVSNNILSISPNGRGFDSTVAITHPVGTIVEKYELAGVSLRRINNVSMPISGPIESDSYYIEFNRGVDRGVDRSSDSSITSTPQLSFNSFKFAGGSNVKASQNIIYNSVLPTYDVLTPGSITSVDSSIRTVTGTSINGSESSFEDNGYEPVQLNTLNTLNSVRLVCSEQNQNEYLTNLPRKKSFTTAITLNTSDSNLSPVLNLNTAFTEFYSNRLNNPINNYSSDSRVNSILDDPHVSSYYTNIISLDNPATSLKVIISAERPESTDFRVLYSLIREDSSEIGQSFELFPGYDNITIDGNGDVLVLDPSKNSGLPDNRVPSSRDGEFSDYEYTADNLDLFSGFMIKIVMSGTNQAETPKFNDIRVLAVR